MPGSNRSARSDSAAASAEANAEGKCFGGSARLVTAIADARERGRTTRSWWMAVTSSRARCSTPITRAKLAAEMMNKMGYDAMTVGNHEFDDGPEVLRGFVDAVEVFPVLMSNADLSPASRNCWRWHPGQVHR